MSSLGYLVDTHALLWNLGGDKRLKQSHFDLFSGSENLFLSTASIWEIAIKISIGKLVLAPGFLKHIENSRLISLQITPDHAMAVKDLPHHHRDPFDRMLVAQAQIEKLTIMTMDKFIPLYDVKTI